MFSHHVHGSVMQVSEFGVAPYIGQKPDDKIKQ